MPAQVPPAIAALPALLFAPGMARIGGAEPFDDIVLSGIIAAYLTFW